MDIQNIIYEFSEMINQFYRLQILIVLLSAFIIIVFNSYYLLQLLAGNTSGIQFISYSI